MHIVVLRDDSFINRATKELFIRKTIIRRRKTIVINIHTALNKINKQFR